MTVGSTGEVMSSTLVAMRVGGRRLWAVLVAFAACVAAGCSAEQSRTISAPATSSTTTVAASLDTPSTTAGETTVVSGVADEGQGTAGAPRQGPGAAATATTNAVTVTTVAVGASARFRITYGDEHTLYSIDADGSGRRRLVEKAMSPVWSRDGRFVALRWGNLLEVVAADGTGRTTVATDAQAFLVPDWSPDGKWIAYAQTLPSGQRVGVAIVRRDGTGRRTLAPGDGLFPTFSSDGGRIAYVSARAVWVVDTSGNQAPERVTPLDVAVAVRPQLGARWSPTSNVIAFTATRGSDPIGIWTVRGDGSDLRRIVSDRDTLNLAWSPDGARLALRVMHPQAATGSIATVQANGTDLRMVVTDDVDGTPNEFASHPWSPDGTRLAFTRGQQEVWIAHTTGDPAPTRVVTTAHAGLPPDPAWQPPLR